MPKLFIPESNRSESVGLEERILVELGMDGLERKQNPLTGKTELVAPEGMGFELGGKFLLTSDQNDIAIWGCPVPSTAMREEQGSWYDDDYIDLEQIDTFVGTRLSLDISSTNRRLMHNDDNWDSYFTRDWCYDDDSDSDRPVVTLCIAGEVEAWYEAGLMPYAWQKGNDILDWQLETPDIPLSLLFWRIPVAEGDLLDTTVSLVPHNPPTPGIKPVEIDEPDKRFWLPNTGLSDEMFTFPSMSLGFYNANYGRELSAPVPEDEYDNFMRYLRMQGRPMDRDPLKNFVILEGDKYSSDKLDLDTEVELAKTRGQKPLGYFDAQRLQENQRRKKVEELREEREQNTFIVIGDTAMHLSATQPLRSIDHEDDYDEPF